MTSRSATQLDPGYGMPSPDRAVTAAPPGGRGARERPAEQGFFGLLKVDESSLGVHLEGDARWTPGNRRSHGGRSGFGVARGQRAAGAGGRQARAHRALSLRLAAIKQRRRGHDPGRVIRDLAVMLADGGECVSDLGAVRDQQALFGPVASDSTAFRVIDRIAADPGLLDALRAAHARARERFWELHGAPRAADDRCRRDADHRALREGGRGRQLQGRLRVSPAARPTRMRRARRWVACCGRATPARTPPPTTSTVLEPALEQIPAEHIETIEILVRADSAGATHGLIDYCRERGPALLGRLRADRAGPRSDPRRSPRRPGSRRSIRTAASAQNGEVAEITDSVDLSLAGRRARG